MVLDARIRGSMRLAETLITIQVGMHARVIRPPPKKPVKVRAEGVGPQYEPEISFNAARQMMPETMARGMTSLAQMMSLRFFSMSLIDSGESGGDSAFMLFRSRS